MSMLVREKLFPRGGTAWAVLSLFFSVPLFASSQAGEPGRLLNFGAGARSLGMGTAYTALAQDATATYWNPAGLAAVRRHDLNLLHSELYGGATYDYFGYAGLRSGPGVWGAHLARLSVDGAQRRDHNNNLLGTFGYHETDLGIGYGAVLERFPTLGFGVAGNILSRDLNGSSDRLMGVDFGSQYALRQNVGLGLVFKNLLNFSQGDTDDKLPRQMRLGVGYRPMAGLVLSGDVENFSRLKLGVEYSYSLVSARMGFLENRPTFGAGVHWKSLTLDYAMATAEELGASQRISIGYAFGKLKGSETDLNPELSLAHLVDQSREAIEKGYYVDAERLLRSARRVKPNDREIQDKVERLSLVTPNVQSATGWDRVNKLMRAGINDYLDGKNVDGLWRMTYAYSIDKGQAGLWRLIQDLSKASNYEISLYDNTSPLTLTQQILSQALAAFRSQHYDEAVNLCQRVITLEPNNALAYKRLGSALYALRQFDAAKSAWQKAMAYETNAADKEQLKTFIEAARQAALGLPAHMPGDAKEMDEDVDLESDMGRNE